MKRSVARLFFLLLVITLWQAGTPSLVQAFTITSDPQFVVMNFSTVNELDWAAPEAEWQSNIKPQILAELNDFQSALPIGTANRRLAWSTLLEYMNFPWDDPGPDSAYVIKVRRIFEISRELNLPVFLPLNGFQWWDELPELYNWWDPDGTHTPEVFFSRQDDPADFKRRFIAGYDPNNVWNVEWQDFTTPMNLNWRNWGGGGFRLAPPPNIASPTTAQLHPTYNSVMAARLSAIATEIANQIAELEAAGQSELFAGLTIGTEVSLNASATPRDEFEPYGYRAIQDTICGQQASCGATRAWSEAELQAAREKAVHAYLVATTRLVHQAGIPAQRIYTHVWAEAEPGEPRFAPYAAAAVTDFSRPGISMYGYATKPFELDPWRETLETQGLPNWGAVEFSTDKNLPQWRSALTALLDAAPDQIIPPAKVIVIYNWSEHKNTPAITALSEKLAAAPTPSLCQVPEIMTTSPAILIDPTKISWRLFTTQPNQSFDRLQVWLQPGIQTEPSEKVLLSELGANETELTIPKLRPGVYTWFVQGTACFGAARRRSEQRRLVISHDTEAELPRWVEWWLTVKTNIKRIDQK